MLTTKQLTIAAGMMKLRDTMKRLLGAEWPERTALHRAVLEKEMRDTNDHNPLSAVIPIAKKMQAAGENPTLLMAVAVDMADLP